MVYQAAMHGTLTDQLASGDEYSRIERIYKLFGAVAESADAADLKSASP